MNSTEATCSTPTDSERTQYAALTKNSYTKIYNLAYRLSGNRAEAEDLVQEAFYRGFRSFSTYHQEQPFNNWMSRIVTRLFLDSLRYNRRRVTTVSLDNPLTSFCGDENLYFEIQSSDPSPEASIVDRIYSDNIQNALNMLSPDQRRLLDLADVEGMPYQEIADIFNKPIGTIRSRLHRTHKAMKLALKQQPMSKSHEANGQRA